MTLKDKTILVIEKNDTDGHCIFVDRKTKKIYIVKNFCKQYVEEVSTFAKLWNNRKDLKPTDNVRSTTEKMKQKYSIKAI